MNDPDLTINEKRAILSSWASDACAIRLLLLCGSHPAQSARSHSTKLWMPSAALTTTLRGRAQAEKA